MLEVAGLGVRFGGQRVVHDVSFTVAAGQCVAIVGESGAGKSVTTRALVGLTGPGSVVEAGTLRLDGTDLTALDERGWRRVRGRRIGLAAQDALLSLDPLRRVGREVVATPRIHRLVPRRGLGGLAVELLRGFGVRDPEMRARQYVHQLSGGLRQRALVAATAAARPELLIADEPTTALDWPLQRQVLDVLIQLRDGGTGLLLTGHDLQMVYRLADWIVVMYRGTVVESGPARRVLTAAQHPYTRGLLQAIPLFHRRRTRLSTCQRNGPSKSSDGCGFADLCVFADEDCRHGVVAARDFGAGHQVSCWKAPLPPLATVIRAPVWPARVRDEVLLEAEGLTRSFRLPRVGRRNVVDDVSFRLDAGETLGLVGASASGKTTTARMILGMLNPDRGSVWLRGRLWNPLPERRRRDLRRGIQAVSQDPLGSFDPRFTVSRIVGEALSAVGMPVGWARQRRIAELLDQVGLGTDVLDQVPHQLSGGQAQRVALARALAVEPDVLVCDEPMAALDVWSQAQLLDLLAEFQQRNGMALLFISHDLGVIRHISDRVVVMDEGKAVESGDTTTVFRNPQQRPTIELLAAVPEVTAPVRGFGPWVA
ncbi:hypothetical protein ED92_40160 [Amycolatopsis sp. MJM2582]|nr:hypothetical protein ED92_40160 [Amycolatopsis sp. MJM2582]